MSLRLLVLVACSLISACGHALDSKPIQIVFVCQHGYAKSLVAALHFERKAAVYGLHVRAVARGLTPAAAVSPAIIAGLAGDGFNVAGYRPTALTEADVVAADRVISFAVDVAAEPGMVTRFDEVPALSENYGKGRDRIVELLDTLIADLQRERQLVETD